MKMNGRFKRILVPNNLIEKWNLEIGNKDGRFLKEMALIVDVKEHVSDEEIWNLMINKSEHVVTNYFTGQKEINKGYIPNII
jgi:hypothetical protein